jgi:hypothetical protein
VAICLFVRQPVSAQEDKPLFDPTIFGRDLVAQVEGVIAIWAMAPDAVAGWQAVAGFARV